MGYKKKIAETKSHLEKQIPKEFSVFDPDVWSQVAKTAGLELELGGVPCQSQRHLITSWAAMCTGVNLALSLIRREHANRIKELRADYYDRLDDKDEIKSATTNQLESSFENRTMRAVVHVSDENERAMVAEELAAK